MKGALKPSKDIQRYQRNILKQIWKHEKKTKAKKKLMKQLRFVYFIWALHHN